MIALLPSWWLATRTVAILAYNAGKKNATQRVA